MAELTDIESEQGTSTTLRDQRRPGRPKLVSPHLIPLLRGEAAPVPDTLPDDAELTDVTLDPDRGATLSAARGICLGVVLGSMIWGCIGAGFWYYFSG
jgi:hypothetical protein